MPHHDVTTKLKAAAKSGAIREIFVFGEAADGVTPFESLLNNDGKGVPEDVKIDPKKDIAVLPYSSGTTGFPKVENHASLVALDLFVIEGLT